MQQGSREVVWLVQHWESSADGNDSSVAHFAWKSS